MDILNEVRKEKEIKNMNSKVKGVLQILLVLVLIAAFAFVAGKGLGAGHRGSAKNIRLGLDLIKNIAQIGFRTGSERNTGICHNRHGKKQTADKWARF